MNLDAFLNHDVDSVQQAAGRIVTLNVALKEGKISQEEYESLCRTVLQAKQMQDDMQNMQTRQQVEEAFQQIATIIGIFI